MTDQEFKERVVPLFTNLLGVSEGQVTPAACLVSDLGMDSLDIIELVMAVEEEFEIMVDDEVVENCSTVSDVVTAITNSVGPVPATTE